MVLTLTITYTASCEYCLTALGSHSVVGKYVYRRFVLQVFRAKRHTGTPRHTYGDPTLIAHRDLQKMYTLNKYQFFIFIYYTETMNIFVTHIN